ncbi:hypothetical protein D5086_030851, partial [Populus alba]
RRLHANPGIGSRKLRVLRRRQVKIEAEAWELATKEYKELLKDMCEHKLAPNLPYMKSLFLCWFEPFTDAIAKEQELIRTGKSRQGYAPYFDLLPADKMSVIAMHQLAAMVMTGGEHGCARVVTAACMIGDAIEQEIRIHNILEKTRKKKEKANDSKNGVEGESPAVMKEQENLRKKVTDLIKKQKLPAVRKIVKAKDDSKPWNADARAKVGSRLIELLLQTAYIQPPCDQLADSPSEPRPAFVHAFRTVSYENKKGAKKYGVIQCDPLVLKGLEKTARHMVIPYMPMLVPPLRWRGYDKGAHLFLPSYVMRIHGAKQQREAVKRAPRKQLQPVFEALDTLGNTRWRVNKRVLSVVDRIWSNGGCLADLVDHSDVPLPEKPETEDQALLKKWKWKLRGVKKENRERHAQRCEIELKLADGSCNGLQHYAALGRDKLGAATVNLVAGEKPADVYSGIAARKLVKQTVMTSVYGVTYIGARDQIKRRLKERGITEESDIFGCSCYAAKVTLTALGEMFEAARSIMNWLGDCAKIIASENEPVRWTTPLGLPVVQPYRKLGRRSIKTSLQVLILQKETDKVMVQRQRTAFPPNFVHSLDSSHMMMTAVACKGAGLNFAGVHDSYWTHACDVDEMNRILREKFVELYETPILENLLESFEKSFPTLSFPPLPDRGDFELREVLESPYFFN